MSVESGADRLVKTARFAQYHQSYRLDHLSADQWIHLYYMKRASGWDIGPRQWASDQIQAALVDNIVPDFDAETEDCRYDRPRRAYQKGDGAPPTWEFWHGDSVLLAVEALDVDGATREYVRIIGRAPLHGTKVERWTP